MATCHACGADGAASDQYCQRCGASLNPRHRLPWYAAVLLSPVAGCIGFVVTALGFSDCDCYSVVVVLGVSATAGVIAVGWFTWFTWLRYR
jgi:hypothetical protein